MRGRRSGGWAVLFLLMVCGLLVYFGWIGEPEQGEVQRASEGGVSGETVTSRDSTDWLSAIDPREGGGNALQQGGADPGESADVRTNKDQGNDSAIERLSVVGADFEVCTHVPGAQAGSTIRLLNHWRDAAEEKQDALVGLKPYTSESRAWDDFLKHQCVAAFLPGDLLKEFNRYTYTIGAFGALPEPGLLRDLLHEIRKGHNQSRLSTRHGDVIGILPAGTARLVMRTGEVEELDDFEDMLVAMDSDRAVELWASGLGIRPFSTDDASEMSLVFRHRAGAMIATPSQLRRFDIGAAPDDLSILETPIFQRTRQLVVHKDMWSDELKQFTRDYFNDVLFDKALAEVKASRKAWSSRFFTLEEPDRGSLRELLRELRQSEREQGHYDSDMLLLLSEIRCRGDKQPEARPPGCQ